MNTFRIVPAYGRDYRSEFEFIADFYAEKDFLISDIGSRWDNKPINVAQMEHGDEVFGRFGNLSHSFRFKVDKKTPWILSEQIPDKLVLCLKKVSEKKDIDKRLARTLMSLGLMSRATLKITPKGVALLAEIEKRMNESSTLTGVTGTNAG